MSTVIEGVYKQVGQADTILPLSVDSTGRLQTTATATVSSEVEIKNDSGNPIPVSFPSTPTVNIGTIPEVEIKNDSGNPIAVAGSAAVGNAPSAPPLSVSGVDSGGLKRHFLTDTSGNQSIFAAARSCLGRQTISVTTGTVVTLTVPANSAAAMIQADGNSVSITLDGTTPTATVGIRIDDGIFFYVDTALANVKLIARTATTNVQVAYFDKA